MTVHNQSTLRLRLLQTWEQALLNGRLYPGVVLDQAERALTLNWISALACIGLENDRLEVGLDEVPEDMRPWITEPSQQETSARPGRQGLKGIDVRLAATWGDQLGLVQLGTDKVRFQHSLIQAYLGSRLIDRMLTEKYWSQALGERKAAAYAKHPLPGREFLIALVLHSRREAANGCPANATGTDGQPRLVSREAVCSRLRKAAAQHYDNKALDIYAAALEIAGAPDQPGAGGSRQPATAMATITTATRIGRGRHLLTVREAKAGVGGTVTDPRHGAGRAEPATSLADIGNEILGHWHKVRSDDLETLEEAKIGLVRRFGVALHTLGESDPGRAGDLGYKQLYDICCQDESYRVRLAGAQEIGRGGCAAYRELHADLSLSNKARMPWAWQLSAWLAPLLVRTVAECHDHGHRHDRKDPDERATLEEWLNALRGSGEARSADRSLSISEEIALAQGFKYAANRRSSQLHTRPEACTYLENRALEMLRDTGYWFAELTLIQALALWAQPEVTEPPPEERNLRYSPGGRPRPNPDETVERWLDIIASKSPGPAHRNSRLVHPFVEAAADMANRALAVRQPGRFLWMDESDVVSRVGAGQPTVTRASARKPQLWIPPSMGWSALDPEAQQLLADVLLLLNLAERGDPPEKAGERLRRANIHQLPPCITRDRRPLQPLLTVGRAGVDRKGTCLDGCQFQLCPYPPKGLQHHRTELSEEFCRRQYRLVRRYPKLVRRTARWQGISVGQLRMFWAQMAERARNSPG